MIVHADFVHGMQSGPLATNPAAIGTTHKPPERSSRLNITQKQCRLQVHPTVLYRSALSDGCPHHLQLSLASSMRSQHLLLLSSAEQLLLVAMQICAELQNCIQPVLTL